MSRNIRIIQFGVIPVLVLCICGCVAFLMFGPELASRLLSGVLASGKNVAAQIADYDLPTGYSELTGMDLVAYQVVSIGASGRRTGMSITLMQYKTPGVSREQMEQQMRQSSPAQFIPGVYNRLPDHTATIKGKPVVLTMTEMDVQTQGAKSVVQMAQGVFQGKGGPVLLMVQGSEQQWDWDVLDAFFASIR